MIYGCQPKNGGVSSKSSNLIGFSIISPSILGYHYFWKHPYEILELVPFAFVWSFLMEKIRVQWKVITDYNQVPDCRTLR